MMDFMCIEESFEVSTSELKKLVDLLPYPIMISEDMQTENACLFFNQNFVNKIGYQLSDASNTQKLTELLYPEENYRKDIEEQWKLRQIAVKEKGKRFVKIKAQLTCKSGEKKWYEIKESIINGLHITAFVNINSDVLLQEKLKRTNVNNDRMLSILGHDLKSPISNLIAISFLAEQSEISQQEFVSLMGRVKEQSTEVLKLLDTTFTWARMNFNTMQHNDSIVDINLILENVLKIYKSALESKNIQIFIEVNELGNLFIDAEILTIIVRNLISNSIKFTPKDGTIFISATANKLIIKDNGIGMTPEMIALILENNYFTRRGTANEKGIGVGLQLVQNLAEKINCKLQIESEANRGTTIAIIFEDCIVNKNLNKS
ncbi:HAMP domain-containing histidine kinase [Flavobacterium sp. 17A]|uniref:HAMP domain-containing histidine kinase n=1 Tax=Flavobacterium potami TaxID=2872310 RepID=A0A9X1H6J6_9FLAO|nr:HAMP domain-containing sensor histidine kinase [Flavobacterium potami]MBZ4033738.1 HAMP domain-containing histidine kinase [Flavobacterium potami]